MIIFWLKEALKSIGRAKSSFILSLISTSISVLLIVASLVVIKLSYQFQSEIKNKITLNVFLKDDVSQKEIDSLQSIIENKNYVSSVHFIDKEEAAQNFIKETGEDFRKIIDYNPLPVSFLITLKEDYVKENALTQITNELSKLNGVDDVVYQYKFASSILSFLEKAKKYIIVLTTILFLISIYIVYSTIKLVISLQQEELETMKLVGAKLSTIKIPVILNGIFIGFLAGLIALGVFLGVLKYFDNLIFFQTFVQSVKYYAFLLFLIGPVLCFLVSSFALRKINLKI
jgi:cell division transport system permease protein